MPLPPGSRIGIYEVTAAIGAGGMGEVYRARDTKLNRDVALKVLPQAMAGDAGRLRRFEREAQVLAALNHPNIAAIYGMEGPALVMEFVDGETLAGPLPVEEAIALAKQIAEALEYAHEKGIIHRDLKPANIKVTPEGNVKVLDFGLAKAMAEDPESQEYANSPTLSLAATKMGMILGTAGYMSPEQAKGANADRRADIWAFGVVLFELLAGKRLIDEPTASEALAAVLKSDLNLSALPPNTPPRIRRLIERCLQRNRQQRLQAIGEARITLESQEQEPDAPVIAPAPPTGPSGGPSGGWIAAGVLAVALAATGFVAWRATRPAPLRPLLRLELEPGAEALFPTRPGSSVALSPDGTRLVTYGRGADGLTRLYTRLLDQAQSVPLPGTESAWDTFFSPDGQWLGFYSRVENRLKKVSVQGGPAVTLCEASALYGGSWGDNGDIIASLDGVVLSRIPSAGGAPQQITHLNKEAGEAAHREPQVLPGSEAVLFTSKTTTSWEQATIELQSLKTGERKTLARGGYNGRYVPSGPDSGSGHLLYIHQATLFAAPMNLAGLELTGPPVPVLEGVRSYSAGGGADFSFSINGTFLFLAGGDATPQRALLWLDSTGKTAPIRATLATYRGARVSPDGKRLAVSISDSANMDVFVYEVERDTMQRLTFTPGTNNQPAWAPDGTHLVFFSNRSGSANIYWMRADGAGEAQRLTEGKKDQSAPAIAPDGKHLAFVERSSEGRNEIWALPLDVSDPDHPKPGKPEVFLRTTFNENAPAFSPDGRWLAYQSNESGHDQVYVRPYPGPGGKWQVSTAGGSSPAWSRNGRELFYQTPENRIMAVAYAGKGDSFQADKPRLWANKQFTVDLPLLFDPAPDGKRIAVVAIGEAVEQGSARVTFLLNFFDELRRKAPGKN